MLHDDNPAPKSDARVRPPVDDALVNKSAPVVRLLEVSDVAVVVASVDVPETESVDENDPSPPISDDE